MKEKQKAIAPGSQTSPGSGDFFTATNQLECEAHMETETQITDKPVEEMQAVSLEELKIDVWEAALFKGEAMDAAHKFDKALNAYREAVVKDERQNRRT